MDRSRTFQIPQNAPHRDIFSATTEEVAEMHEQLKSGSLLRGFLVVEQGQGPYYVVVVDEAVHQGWIYNARTARLEVRKVKGGMYIGQNVIPDESGVMHPGDAESHHDLLPTLLQAGLLPYYQYQPLNVSGALDLTDESDVQTVQLDSFGKPTSKFEFYPAPSLSKLRNANIPCRRISRIETNRCDWPHVFVLDPYNCTLVKLPILRTFSGLSHEGGVQQDKTVYLVYNPLEFVGIWYVGSGRTVALQKVWMKRMLRDAITADFCDAVETDKRTVPTAQELFTDAVNSGSRREGSNDEWITMLFQAKQPRFVALRRLLSICDMKKICVEGESARDYILYDGEYILTVFHDRNGWIAVYDQSVDHLLTTTVSVAPTPRHAPIKFSKPYRYMVHRIVGREHVESLRLAELGLVPNGTGNICTYCQSESTDYMDHVQRRCLYTIRTLGLYVCTSSYTPHWIREELERQRVPTQYRNGAFGPMLTHGGIPLTLSQAVSILMGNNMKGPQGTGTLMQISYYGVIAPPISRKYRPRRKMTRHDSRT
ncbi:VP5 [Eriocheir sinensis reovirus]|uniref:VP5 n=1 Tax=Eriocheir sinensis reovirus TaxID=273810 RepID=A0A0E3T5B0_ESRV|nr:VP5 [Eriocheir sinensis reovirus]AKC01924.1 VP5 [Eriocheir sinensis reovirus]